MWFKVLLSRIFKRDFTATAAPTQVELDQARALYDALPQAEKDKIAASWTGNCNAYEVWWMNTFHPTATHMCCDAAVSSVPCSYLDRAGLVCSGHGGPCCSKC
jgi:hypothetical protein